MGLPAYGGGIYCSYLSKVKVVNCIIWDNFSSHEGSQLAVGSGDLPYPLPSSVEMTHTDVQVSVEPVESIDVVFCIDTTFSMRYDIDAVKASAAEIISEIARAYPDLRLAVVDYRDFDEPNFGHGGPGDYPYHTVSKFTDSIVAAQAAINSLMVAPPNTYDWPESAYAGLMHCINHNSVHNRLAPNFYGADPASTGPGEWRSGNVKKVIIVMSDAPPHDPEPFTGFTLGDIVAAANARRINIFSVVTGRGAGEGGTEAQFTDLAEGTGGAMLAAADATEVVDAFMEAIALISRPVGTVYVEQGCVLAGWEPDDPNDFYTWDVNSWDANSRNIEQDPCFVNIVEEPNLLRSYHLSHIDAGQEFNSPCLDIGDMNFGLDPNEYTTRTDAVGDGGIIDLGYHYLIDSMLRLTVTYLDPNGQVIAPSLAHGYVEPDNGLYLKGSIVQLTAHPESGYRLRGWIGTDDDSITDTNNTVTMTEDKNILVHFEALAVYQLTTVVVGGYGNIEPASGPQFEGIVELLAMPDPNYRVKRWTGTDHDSSTEPNNTVTLTKNTTVTVEFELPRIIEVSGDPNALRDAIDEARTGDILVVAAGTYTGGINLQGKGITVTSTNPDDVNIVAGTVIDCQQSGRGLIFNSGQWPDCQRTWRRHIH
jgi:hypothetical protein